MNALRQDIDFALSVIASRGGYATATILVFTLAIGANTTVFSVFNGFFLRPLPYIDGDQLVSVYNSYPKIGVENAGTSVPDYLDRRGQAPSVEDLAIYAPLERTLTGEGAPERLTLTRASPSLFDVLRVSPMLGRGFTEEEATPGNERVAVLSHRLWNTRFGARPDVRGSDIRLDGEPFRIVGVMPQGFMFPNGDVDAWVPFAITPQQTSDAQRGVTNASSIGRLRPDATIEALNAELDAIVRRNVELGRVQFVEQTGFTGQAEPWRAVAVGDLEQMLLLLQGIVLAVLLMVCANVANLQLARMAARRKELAVRAALGAAQGRLARLVVAESLVLALLGAAGGVALAHGGLELVRVSGSIARMKVSSLRWTQRSSALPSGRHCWPGSCRQRCPC